jgi:hypothetical protein
MEDVHCKIDRSRKDIVKRYDSCEIWIAGKLPLKGILRFKLLESTLEEDTQGVWYVAQRFSTSKIHRIGLELNNLKS